MISVEQAQQWLDQQLSSLPEIKTLKLEQAAGYVLAENVVSGINVPPADNSAMDGYAIQLQHLQAGEPYPVTQRICAGDSPEKLSGGIARIFTGAEIPAGADSVVIQENTSKQPDGSVVLNELPAKGANIRPAGQDIRKGQSLLKKGQRLGPAQLGLLASIGLAEVDVYQPLRVAVLNSGDELVEPGQPLAPGQIYNSNAVLLKALLAEDAVELLSCEHVSDNREQTREQIRQLSGQVDVLVCSGGVSVGEEDHVGQVLQELGELTLWKLAIKPGKPLAYARVGNTHCFGLPGNPVSCFVTYHIIVRRFLRRLQGEHDYQNKSIKVPVAELVSAGKREEYFRASLGEEGTVLYENQSSGVLSSVAFSDGLLRVPANTSLRPGELADFYLV